MNIKRLFLVVVMVMGLGCSVFAATVKSPDGQVALSFGLKDVDGVKSCAVYEVAYKGKVIVKDSLLGFELGDGSKLGGEFEVRSTATESFDRTWKPVYGERSRVRDHYNQVTVELAHTVAPRLSIRLEFRCYDVGAALRYTIQKSESVSAITIKKEDTEFRFPGDHVLWLTKDAQGRYQKKTISTMGEDVERPLTIKVDDDIYVAIAEANLVDYARTKLSRSKNGLYSIVTHIHSAVQGPLPLSTPWRVIMLADSEGRLLENNDILLNLSEPCEIADTSWIKPGKVIREVTLTTAGGKACVDFAVEHNLQYVEYDAGWYGHEYSDESDATTVTVDPQRSKGPLDLHEVIRYAAERDIGIILYVNRRALERQLDDILPLYEKWGVKGLKYGFVQVGSQEWTSWLHEAIRKAAKYHMMVDVHDNYRPTGYSRTYPNLMTQEGIAGDETSPDNNLTLTILFTRMLAGAGDNTVCYRAKRVEENATHAYQLAKAVCIYCPWQFLYWYDKPDALGGLPELEFYDHMPTVWDDTKVIHGSIGQYAVIARRSGESWFVGCMNSGKERTLDVPLDFLESGEKYIAHIYSDDKAVDTRTRVKIEQIKVSANTILKATMSSQGGQAIRIVPGN